MKVAPGEKKAKQLPSQLLKPKALKAGAAISKKKKEILLKGFSEASLSKNPTLQKSKLSGGSNSPSPKKSPAKKVKKLTPQQKVLPATPSSSVKASPNGTLSRAKHLVESNLNEADACGVVKEHRKKSLSVSTPLDKVKLKSVAEISSPSVQKKDDIKPILSKRLSLKIDTPQLKLLKRHSLVSSPRNSFVVKPLVDASPNVKSKTPTSQRKSVCISTPAKNDDQLSSEQPLKSLRKTPSKQKCLPVPQEESSQLSSPVPKPLTPALEPSIPSRKSLNRKKSLLHLTPGKGSSQTATTTPESAKAIKDLNTNTMAVSTPQSESAGAKKSHLKSNFSNISSVEENNSSLTPLSESKSNKKLAMKRKSLAVSTPSEKSKSGSQVLTPAKVAKQSSIVSVQKSDEKEAVICTPSPNAVAQDTKLTPQVSVPQQSGGKKILKRKSVSAPPEKTNESNVGELSPAKVRKAGHEASERQNPETEKESNTSSEKNNEAALRKKKKKKAASKKKTGERKDLSTDPRLQNLIEAADAILKVMAEKQKGLSKKHLFSGEAQPIHLQLHSVRVPKTPPRIIRFNLPHSIYEENADICLILGDPVKGWKRDTEQEVIVQEYKELLENKGVTNIKELIPFTYLRSQYNQYEMKRKFAHIYDVILCDSRLIGHATHFLGRSFFSDKCITPIRVVDKKNEWVKDFKSAIDFALHKTWLRVHPKGTSYSVVVGNSQQTKEMIAANILATFNELQVLFPGGLDNIKMAVIKGHESLPVPVFVSTLPHNEVTVPVVKAPHDKLGEAATDELSTKPGRVVTVYPGGRIDVRNRMTAEDKEFEETMGNESRWKRQMKQQQAQQLNDGTSENEPEDELEDEPRDKPEERTNFSKKGKAAIGGKRPSQGKKLSPKKTTSPGKKFSSGKKFPTGKMVKQAKTTAYGKKVLNLKQKKIPQKS